MPDLRVSVSQKSDELGGLLDGHCEETLADQPHAAGCPCPILVHVSHFVEQLVSTTILKSELDTVSDDDSIHGLMASYNRTRYVEELLEKTESQPPSFTIHLHPENWVLNNGSKFLYHTPIAVRLPVYSLRRCHLTLRISRF